MKHTVWPFIANHRTKILGGMQVAAGAAMTYLPNIQTFLKPLHYGLITMGIGVTTSLLGFVNTALQEKEPPP